MQAVCQCSPVRSGKAGGHYLQLICHIAITINLLINSLLIGIVFNSLINSLINYIALIINLIKTTRLINLIGDS